MKSFFYLFIMAGVLSFLPHSGSSQVLKPLQLDKNAWQSSKTLVESLQKRETSRDFSEKPLSLQQLSGLMWAANGVNRDDGRRTAPSALNKKSIDIYAVMAEGVYRFDADKNRLVPVVAGDFRKLAGLQDYVWNAPLNLIYVADLSKWDGSSNPPDDNVLSMVALEAGCQVQNVYLYCASEGLATVIRASVDKNELAKAIKLNSSQYIVAGQTVGFPE